MARPKKINARPMALIKSHRLTNKPGESHLNQRLTRWGVCWETVAPHLRFSDLNRRIADLKGLGDIGLENGDNLGRRISRKGLEKSA
ncbi:hypothetical protein OLK001_15320 [Synechocystis sp. LKSZ1]